MHGPKNVKLYVKDVRGVTILRSEGHESQGSETVNGEDTTMTNRTFRKLLYTFCVHLHTHTQTL